MRKIFIIAIVLIACNQPKDAYVLKERNGSLAHSAEWASVRSKALSLQESISKNAEDDKSRLALVSLFIQEARTTGDFAYYNKAALKYVNDVLKKDANNFEALVYKAVIQLSQHHFADALVTAKQAEKINPYNAFIYGIMVDAYVELGNYVAAVECSDRMVSIRPDLRSYSRIAYLREIHGDAAGAIEAMKMAVEAGVTGDEGTEWCRVQLARLYEHTGNWKEAEKQYNISLEERPGYAYALAGLARVASSNKNFDKSIEYYKQALAYVDDPSLLQQLAETYKAAGKEDKALETGKELVHELSGNHHHGDGEQNTDHELASAYLLVNDYDEALEHALAEHQRRPENIEVNETLAWVYYKMGDVQKALPHIKTALRTNCKDPVLLSRSQEIFKAAGQ